MDLVLLNISGRTASQFSPAHRTAGHSALPSSCPGWFHPQRHAARRAPGIKSNICCIKMLFQCSHHLTIKHQKYIKIPYPIVCYSWMVCRNFSSCLWSVWACTSISTATLVWWMLRVFLQRVLSIVTKNLESHYHVQGISHTSGLNCQLNCWLHPKMARSWTHLKLLRKPKETCRSLGGKGGRCSRWKSSSSFTWHLAVELVVEWLVMQLTTTGSHVHRKKWGCEMMWVRDCQGKWAARSFTGWLWASGRTSWWTM